jgi:anionic cell wall polymer biosynthesis LytR-Cps2A-Psr (LCP) family protein
VPNRRHPDGGDSKARKGVWPRRGRKPAPRHGTDQEPVTRWFRTEALPGAPGVQARQGQPDSPPAGARNVPRPPTAQPAPQPSPARTASQAVVPRPTSQARATRTPEPPQSINTGPGPNAATLPHEYQGVAEGRLPADYPADTGRPAGVRREGNAQLQQAPEPVSAGALQTAPRPHQAPVEPPPPARSRAAARRKATPPAPEGLPPRRGRHRTSDKPWSPAPRRKRRRASRPGIRFGSGRLLKGGLVLVLAAVVVTAGAVGFRSLGGGGTGAEEQFGPSVTQTPTTTLLAGTDAGGTEVAWLALLSYDPVAEKGAVVYVPAHTAVEVPGRGLQGMGDALATGGLPLLLVSAESFFGIEIDHYLELPRIRAQTLFEDLGALTVDVPNEVAVAEGKDTRRLLLTEGSQELDSFAIADLLYTIGDEGDDVELGARHLAFWDSILNGSNDPEELRAAFRNASVEAEASGNSGGADGNGLDLVASLAALEGVDLNLAILPARQVSVGGAELYATDNDEIAEFVSTTLPGVPVARNLAGVQVLNGNGSPGIGEKVAQKLVGKGFRIDLSGNADSFKYKKTKVISYDPSPAGQALATKARDLLGVGEVQVSGQGQGSVDLTIIVGKDFLRTR